MDRRQVLGLAVAAVGLETGGASMARANLPAATGSRGYATGPFGLVHYQDTGGDGIPLILCPQAPQSSRQFDSVLPEFSRLGVRAIAIDTPGFGMSDVPKFVPRIEDYAQVIPSVLTHLHINKSHLAGHHTGAAIVTEASLLFPDRVLRLVIHGAHPMDDEERQRGLEYNKAHEQTYVYESDGSHLTETFAVRWRLYGPGADPELTTRVVGEKFMGYGPFWYGHHAAYTYNFNSALARVKHKTLLLTNTGDLIYKNAQIARRMRPDFAYAELPGGTIDIVDQQPAAWAETVTKFLRS